jgi:lipopolysaccharide export system protein LptA
MVAQKGTSMVEFIGNVKATREDSIVFADSIKIYFDDDNKGKDAQSNVKEIISTGNVRYSAGDRKAFADKAVYTTQDAILVLTGKSAKLITGSSFVTGKKITLYRNQDKVIVESDSTQRVEAFFNPEDKIIDKKE